jgi:hypothetical protein
MRGPLQDIRPALAVSETAINCAKRIFRDNEHAFRIISIAAVLSLFPPTHLAHTLPFYGAANGF